MSESRSLGAALHGTCSFPDAPNTCDELALLLDWVGGGDTMRQIQHAEIPARKVVRCDIRIISSLIVARGVSRVMWGRGAMQSKNALDKLLLGAGQIGLVVHFQSRLVDLNEIGEH